MLPLLPAGRRTRRRGRSALALALVVLGGIVPAAAAPTSAAAAGPAPRDGGLRPTIQYEDAVKHAHDKITFAAGARVAVPFTPRRTDRWAVDGRAPRVLPAGRATGRAMRLVAPDATTVRRPRATPPPRADDRPIADPASIFDGTGAAWDSTDSPTFELAAAVDPGALRREVFGFLPYWELSDSSTRLDWDKISTVAYFGVGADGHGNLMRTGSDGSTTVGWSGWTSSRMTSVIDAAHASHARVVLTVQSFAWSSTGLKRQKALLGSATARARLARQIAAAIRDRGADGVNLDFEPIASGYADEFTALVRKVRTELNASARGYQLTFDTTGWIGNYPVEDATKAGGADAIFIMGYDYRSSGSSPVGSIAPSGGPAYDVRDTIKAYLDRVPASKLILGVPYYGRAWSTSSSKLGAKNISGAKYGASVTSVYASARAVAAANGRRYDSKEGVAWTAYKRETCTKTYGCVTAWRQLYYDDATALKAKYDLVNGYDLRGIGIWALGYDGTRTELYQAIKDKFITDTVPPVITSGTLSAPVLSPNGDARFETVTASLKAIGLITWGYRIAPVSGSTVGKAIRSGSKSGRAPMVRWDGTNADGRRVKDGTYRITIWTADISDNRAQRTFTVVLDTKGAAVTMPTSRGYLSPDADGHADTLPLSWSANEPLAGKVGIRNTAGRTVRSWTFAARSAWSTTWTGRDAGGRTVPDGRYTYRVDGRDHAGNRTVVDRAILVDRTIAALRWTDPSFDPRAKQTSRAVINLRRSARITVAVYRGATLVRKVWTDRAAKAGATSWTWNGRTSAGAYVKPGSYSIVVHAKSRFGTTGFSRTVTVEAH